MLCHQKIGCTFFAALVLLCLGWEVQAETISIIASDNAWVQKGKGDESEAQDLFVLSNGSDTWSKFAYFRFDVSPLADVTITSASLDLYWIAAGGNDTVSVLALNDLANGGQSTETSWSGNLIWDKRPQGLGNALNGNTSGLLASLPFVKGAPSKLASFDLTSALPGLLDSDTNKQLTLILYAASSWANFASLANPYGWPVPTLTVDYNNPIPEPGTLALLGMALLGLGWYVWRKRGVTG